MTAVTLTQPAELAFPFLRANQRPPKPRTRGVTEIRGPYYSVMGPRYLKDVLDTMGEHVDAVKFAGGSFTLMPEPALRELIEIAHDHDVLVSTGGFIEHVLTQGPEAVARYIDEVARLGFDILEVSAGFISIPTDDMLRLVERVQRAGLKAKAEVGIQFGAGGATTPGELEQEGTRDVGYAIDLARRCLHDHDRVGGDHRGGNQLAHRRRRDDRARARPGEGHVRGRRPRGVRLVRKELRTRGQLVRRPLADRPARMPAAWHLGHQEPLGSRRDLRRLERERDAVVISAGAPMSADEASEREA
jgi:phosphosulfolactate synthase (CoM biosynthesis protein A)